MRPLEGIRVVEFAAYVSGPLAAKLLADLGADVIKVEPPTGDPARRWARTSDDSPWFSAFNLSKRSVVLATDGDGYEERLAYLLQSADAVVTNLPPTTLRAAGVGEDDVHAVNPRAVYVRILGDTTGGGSERAFDSVAQAATGLMAWGREEPELIPFPLCDVTAALVAVAQVLAGLVSRSRGQERIDLSVSLTEAAALHGIEALTLHSALGLTPSATARAALAQIYVTPTADERWILAHLSSSERAWRGFCEALSLPERIRALDRGERILKHSVILEIARRRSRAGMLPDLQARFRSNGVPHSLVRDAEDVSALISERPPRGIQVVDRIVSATLPMADDAPRPAPSLGEHTEAVLEGLDLPNDASR